MNRSELKAQDKDVEKWMMSKGLAYTAERGYEAHQVYSAATTTGDYTSAVIARVRASSGHDYFSYGFYPRDEAAAVARKAKAGRKYWVMDVTVIHSAERF